MNDRVLGPIGRPVCAMARLFQVAHGARLFPA
jgi:hypothetical protein